jgi:NAD-dependent dihydropyrimidine dehydrogenase PreA subunit
MDVYGWDEEKQVPYLAHEAECQHCGNCYFDCPQHCIDVTYPVCLW